LFDIERVRENVVLVATGIVLTHPGSVVAVPDVFLICSPVPNIPLESLVIESLAKLGLETTALALEVAIRFFDVIIIGYEHFCQTILFGSIFDFATQRLESHTVASFFHVCRHGHSIIIKGNPGHVKVEIVWSIG
jgi:hypothetical protein